MQHISASELIAMQQSDQNLVIIDVRTLEEFEQIGYIEGAQLMPLHELPVKIQAVHPKTPVVVYCQHGVRSLHACGYLESIGFETVYNLSHGYSIWEE